MTIAHASSNYNKEDIRITNFGLNEKGNPFIELQGQVGKFIPDGDEDFYAYVFYTDKGIFAVMVAEGEDEDKPFYSSAQWNNIKHIGDRGDCILSDKGRGHYKFSGHIVEFENPNISFSQVDKVEIVHVVSDDPDDECKTGEIIAEVLSQR
ncbi:MAG TPA: hypothetical protein VFR94_01740 [Nitrososphaeraceae archaeon]|nr:hypothetical protein [Nitrososphaeraceae archaeon]